MRAIVTGASGFIGHHLCRYLKNKGHYVVGIDIDPYKYHDCDEFYQIDIREDGALASFVRRGDYIFALAAQNGSIEFTSKVKADIVHDNTIINLNTAMAAVYGKAERIFFSSSACVYPLHLQGEESVFLKEEDAYPADPDSEYGWEKLYSERMYMSFMEDYGIDVRIARFFNIYGPEGHHDPIKAKAPTAISRKVAQSDGKIEVWGSDGRAMRSFCYIDDCCRAIMSIMNADNPGPYNVGTKEHMDINHLVDIICEVAGKKVEKVYNEGKAQGVRNRMCDFSKIESELGWKPEVSFKEGIWKTYQWVQSQL